ncbi:MAG: tRNA (adenosine(37)-N6)-dimethylallyltransferase MiaA [Flavisolibacter sp.]
MCGVFYGFMDANNKTIIIIGGPTAAGKTSLAIEIARHFKSEIISADSRQCYKELNIGVARPTVEQLQSVKHHFIASHNIGENISAGVFENFALEKALELFNDHNLVVMVGGSGLYIQAFCEGLDEMPTIAPGIREEIQRQYQLNGLKWLGEQLLILDPSYYATVAVKNPQRLIRALEVVKSTGKPFSEFRKGKKKSRPFQIIKIGVAIEKDILYQNIVHRTKHMFDIGLLAEVESLLAFRYHPALHTVGYKELFAYLENKISLKEAKGLIEKNTRHYAKRQMTWFKKDAGFKWVLPNVNQVISSLSF